MSQVQPLVRITGTAHGVRKVDIAAKPEVRDPDSGEVRYEAKPASHYYEVGVAVRGRYGDNVTDGNTATIAVVIDDDQVDDFGSGAEVDCLAYPYVRWVPGFQGRRPFPAAAFRYVAPAAASAAPEAGATPIAAAGGRRR